MTGQHFIPELHDWAIARHGNAAALARATGASPSDVSRWVSGEREVPPKRCYRAALFTGIACSILRPKDYADYGWS
jgi:DNA-binding transcriptional regulator YdaS (Cro superfamily)